MSSFLEASLNFQFLFATVFFFPWGLIKDLEPFTACGWLFI